MTCGLVPDLGVSSVGGLSSGVSLKQELQSLGQHLRQGLLGQQRGNGAPQVSAQSREEIVPHLDREGTPFALLRKRGGERGGNKKAMKNNLNLEIGLQEAWKTEQRHEGDE